MVRIQGNALALLLILPSCIFHLIPLPFVFCGCLWLCLNGSQIAAREKVSGLFRDKLHSQYESSSKSKVAKRRARKTAAASANQVATTHDEEQYDHARNLLDLAMNGNASSKKQSTPPSNDVGSLPSRDIGTVLRHGIHPIGGFMTPNISNLTQLMIAGLRNQAVIHHPHLSLGNWPLTSLNHQVHTIAAAAAALNQSSHSSLLLSSIELKEQRRREIGSLLDRFDLYQYREKFLECGYDNIGWLLEHAMDDSVMKMVSKSVCFKPGHAIRFRHGLAKEAEALGLLTGSSKLPAEDSDDSEDEDGGSDNEKASSTATTVSNSPSPTAADAPAIPNSSRPTLDKASTNTSPSQKAQPLRIWSPL